MLSKWKLANFKSVRDEIHLDLAPLTILAGANSVGKSSWIQSILLIAQTLSNKISSRSVILNGHLARLGQFDDLKSYSANSQNITIGWECTPVADQGPIEAEPFDRARSDITYFDEDTDKPNSIWCQIEFGIGSDTDRDLMQLQPRLYACEINSSEEEEDPDSYPANYWIRVRRRTDAEEFNNQQRLNLSDLPSETVKATLRYDVSLDDNSSRLVRERMLTADVVGCAFQHFLPTRLTIRYDETEEEIQIILSALLGEPIRMRRRRFLDSNKIFVPPTVVDFIRSRLAETDRSLLDSTREGTLFGNYGTTEEFSVNDWVERLRRSPVGFRVRVRHALQEIADDLYRMLKTDRVPRYAVAQSHPAYLSDAFSYLDSFFSRYLKYLGPLRDEPKALYPLALTADPTDVGLRGEYTAAVFDNHKNKYIRYLPPNAFTATGIDVSTAGHKPLEAAVQDWLQYLGVAKSIETRDRGKFGHELKVTTSNLDQPQDLTHVGVGVSQVLPILVMCLLADTDTTLIIEQPELHLHPKVQTRLADFFLSMALLKKQCIIETHSEYLINRLRYRAAIAPGETMSSIIKLYFAEMINDVAQFRPVIVNRYGAIAEWPEGFFDQGQREAEGIIRAGIEKRRRERKERQ